MPKSINNKIEVSTLKEIKVHYKQKKVGNYFLGMTWNVILKQEYIGAYIIITAPKFNENIDKVMVNGVEYIKKTYKNFL